MPRSTVLIDLFFPPRCAFCGRLGVRGVCADCEPKLPRRANPLREGSFGLCAVPLEYKGVARRAFQRFKFGQQQGAADGFGELIAQCAAEELGGQFDRVTWVPASAQRQKERGFDQSLLLARAAARCWDTKPAALLQKQRDNPPQSGLSEDARKDNVRGAYRVRRPALTEGARILLIDDVITTGATLTECRRTLLDAGAASVVCACLISSDA